MTIMKKYLFPLGIIAAASVQAQDFRIVGLPDGLQGQIVETRCAENDCEGGKLVLSKDRFEQTISLESNLGFTRPKRDPIDSRQADAPIRSEDFNFDGRPDLILPGSEMNGPYGSIAHDVYVQTRSGRFVRSDGLSNLYINYMMVEVDKKHKLIKTFTKSGAAFHMDRHFRIIPGKGLQSVYVREEQVLPDGRLRITRKRLTKGKWQTSVKTYTAKEAEKMGY